jgi:L-lactate dehydrogenase
MRVSIVGVGNVGSALAFALVMRSLADELILVGRDVASTEGNALDLRHAGALAARPTEVASRTLAETAGSDVVFLTASAPQRGEVASRLEQARDNTALIGALVPVLLEASPAAIFIVVTNPVDVIATHVWRLGVPRDQVIGTGTLIDSARYREVGIHPDDIRAYILGEHGDSQFPALSLALSGGEWVGETAAAGSLFERARGLGYEVVRRKGHSSYAIAFAAAVLLESIRDDARRTYPISTPVDGFAGVDDVCLSVPAVIGRRGVVRQLHPKLNPEESNAFQRSAEIVRRAYRNSL